MSRPNAKLSSLLVVGFLAAACVTGGGAGGPQTQHNLVTAEELAPIGEMTALDALRSLRPRFLQSREVQSNSNPNPKPVTVFVNGSRTEGIDVLATFKARDVKEMRFFEPQEANVRFGTGNNGGAIAVTMK
jgi:hypothetical protein